MNVSEGAALNAVALMQQATVVDLSAPLWTQDPDFEGLPHVRFRAVLPRK